MHSQFILNPKKWGVVADAVLVLSCAAPSIAADPEPGAPVAEWLGKEITIRSSSLAGLMPVGGKLSFVYDAKDDKVRICTRTTATQQGAWRMDMVPGCSVELTVTRGERYCTVEDVKAGNAEVLSTCHRMRSHDVALLPAPEKGTTERQDVIVFPIQPGNDGLLSIAILVDAPSRVIHGGVIIGGQP